MKTTNPAIALAVLAAVALSAPRASAVTPDKFVRYVEATGSQWVDTGVVGRHGIKTECKVEWMALADTAFLACGYWSANTRFYACWCSTASGNMFTAQRTGDKVNYNSQDLLFEKKRVYTYATDFSAADGNNMSTNTVSIDGTKVFSKAYTALDTGLNLYVFANNQNGTAAAFSKTRCYGLKIWQDGTLVRDFRPCVHGGRAGLYDAKNDRIYYSASGTDLTYDTNCDVPDAFIDYVESFGNSYVDTKVTGRSGTAAKMEMAWVGTSSDQALLDSRNGNNRFYLAHRNSGDRWLWGYGDYGNFGSFTPGERYYVDSSFAVGAQTITVREGGPDGTIVSSYEGTSATSIDTGRSMYLFCCNQSGSALAKQYWGKARVYSLQLFQDGDLVRDFRPCLKYGQAALYDDVSKTIFYPEGDPLGYDNSVAADPKKLVFVDYIESDGFTHLDTQVDAYSPTRATGEMTWLQVRTSAQERQYYCETHRSYLACGYYNSGSDANRFYLVDETAQKYWIGYGNNAQTLSPTAVEGQKVAFDVSFAAGAQTFELTPDGGSASTSEYAWSGEANGYGTLYLFACNDAKNGKPIYRSAARCHGLTIYQNGDDANPVRDFKPCVLDGQAALYDTVSGRVFYPVPAIPAAGNTGAILPESANSEPKAFLEWVETDGTQFIDIGVVGRTGTTAEFLETCLKTSDEEECFLGSVAADWQTDRFYMWYYRTRFALGLGYAGEFWTPSLADPTAKASDWNPATNPDAYPLPNGAQTHARVSFAAGSQRVMAATNATDALKLVSSRTIAGDIDTGCNLYLFARNNNGTPDAFAKSRLYWLRIWQDGARVRRCQPVRLKNGLVALWDSVGKKAYLPTTAEGGFAAFSAVGPETDELVTPPLVLVVR